MGGSHNLGRLMTAPVFVLSDNASALVARRSGRLGGGSVLELRKPGAGAGGFGSKGPHMEGDWDLVRVLRAFRESLWESRQQRLDQSLNTFANSVLAITLSY